MAEIVTRFQERLLLVAPQNLHRLNLAEFYPSPHLPPMFLYSTIRLSRPTKRVPCAAPAQGDCLVYMCLSSQYTHTHTEMQVVVVLIPASCHVRNESSPLDGVVKGFPSG